MSGQITRSHVLQEQNSRTQLTTGNAPSKKLPQYVAAVVSTVGAFVAGSFMGYTSPALPLLQRPLNPFLVTPEAGSWIGALLNVGALLGAAPAGAAADRFGRKRTLALLAVPLTVAWLLIAFSDSVAEIYVGRVLGGMAVGAVSVAAPMYIAEMADSNVRGALGSLFQLQITLGILFGYLVGLVGVHRDLALISAAVPILYFLGVVWMPESPLFLLMKGRRKDAGRALQWFRGDAYDVQEELSRMQDALTEQQEKKSTCFDLVSSRSTLRALLISLGLMLFQQWSGINAVIFYAGKIFKDAGSQLSPEIATIIMGTVQVLATAVSTVLVDRAGRRILLLVSSSIMCLCLGVLGLHFHLMAVEYDVTSLAWLPLVAVAVFIVVFSIGFGPLPWVIISELFPSNVKGSASATSAAFNWLQAFLVTKVFQNMVEVMGLASTFWVFAATSACATAFVVFVVPETKGKTLEDIQLQLRGRLRPTVLVAKPV